MKILITGGCGFVGSNLCIKIQSSIKNVKVTALDNFYRKGSIINKKRLIDNNIDVIKCDVRNFKELDKVPKFDFLIDCAADPSALSGVKDGLEYLFETNLNGTLNCLKLVRKFNAKIIFLSSSRVYPFDLINKINFRVSKRSFVGNDKGVNGFDNTKGISEDFNLEGLKTFYGFTKYSSENLIKEYCKAFNLEFIINRSGVIAGPWQWGRVDQGFIGYWLLCYFFKKKLNYIGYKGKGNQVRDILHIDDLYNLVFLQLNEFYKFRNNTFNIGGGFKNKISLANLTYICDDIFDISKKIYTIKETRYGDIPYYVTNFNKINKLSGWKPEIPVQKTVEDIYEWTKNNLIIFKKLI